MQPNAKRPPAGGGAGRPDGWRLVFAGPQTAGLFARLHADEHGFGWCQCVAWWAESSAGAIPGSLGFEGWGERSASENRALRASLGSRGVFDGAFLVEGDGLHARPLGWAQVARRDELGRLARVFERPPDRSAWALGCLAVVPAARRRGVARALLEALVQALPERGARTLEAFPRERAEHGAEPDSAASEGSLWNGPLALFEGLGFRRVGAFPPRLVLELRLRRPRESSRAAPGA